MILATRLQSFFFRMCLRGCWHSNRLEIACMAAGRAAVIQEEQRLFVNEVTPEENRYTRKICIINIVLYL